MKMNLTLNNGAVTGTYTEDDPAPGPNPNPTPNPDPGPNPTPSTCGPGEVMGPGDVEWEKMSMEGLFPQTYRLTTSGSNGVAVRFTANAAMSPNGIEFELTDEDATGPKDVKLCLCPHNFDGAGGPGTKFGNESRFKFYGVFVPTGTSFDYVLENGKQYVINVRGSSGQSIKFQLSARPHP